MAFQQILTGSIEPHDLAWREASLEDRRWLYKTAGDIALERLKLQLSRAIGRNGRVMKPRIIPVLPDGSSGPVMTPHGDLSRAITLSDYMSTERSLTLFWHSGSGHRDARAARAANARARSFARNSRQKGKGERVHKFNDILEFHALGQVPNAPVRDVRLSQASIQQVKLEVGKRWKLRVAGREGDEEPSPLPMPAPEPVPELPQPWVPEKIGATGRTDLEHFTFGIGGGSDLAQRAIDAGYATGFRRLPKKAGGAKPTAGVPLPSFPPFVSRPAPAVVPVAVPLPAANPAASYALGSPAVPLTHVTLPTFDVLPVQLPYRAPRPRGTGGFDPRKGY